MYAIVATGGKQYKVEKGDVFEVEKLNAAIGESVALDAVFIADGSTVITESDKLAVAKVFAEVIEHFKGDKQLIFKFKKRKGYKRLRGHRQNLTRLEVIEISLTGDAPEKRVADETKTAESKTLESKPITLKQPVASKTTVSKSVAAVKEETPSTEAKPAATRARKTAAEKVEKLEKVEKAEEVKETEKSFAKTAVADELVEKKPTRKTPAKKSVEANDASNSK